ncbi:anti-sigma regulatory factor (Ser/Thr protein kinase) [Streptomyces canus]|nr:anti-sigma regulatory factor (Ser/Thr protein kinase) [Streptomyces canus]
MALLMARLGGIEPDDVAEWRISLDPVEGGRARAVVREQLHVRLADGAELMVSELVTNVVRHSHRRPVELRLVRGDCLLCEVDDDHDLPNLLSAGPTDEHGRGLRVVSTLAGAVARTGSEGMRHALVRVTSARYTVLACQLWRVVFASGSWA